MGYPDVRRLMNFKSSSTQQHTIRGVTVNGNRAAM